MENKIHVPDHQTRTKSWLSVPQSKNRRFSLEDLEARVENMVYHDDWSTGEYIKF